jgi:predicted amidohydrolase YtcJ
VTRRYTRREFVGLAAAAAIAAPDRARADAAEDLLLHGGRIYTGTGAVADALLTRGERIAFVGPLAEARRRNPRARPIDLAGATAFPGFVDAHAHLLGIGLRELTLNLEGTRSIDDLIERLRAAAAAQPRGPIVGRGWIETHWPDGRFPGARDLDRAVADRPVYLRRADGHAGVANSAALALAGIDARTQDPPGGRILRDARGAATGMLIDAAEALVADRMPTPDRETRRLALARADALYAERGWTGIHAMSVGADELDLLLERAATGSQGLRVDAYLDPSIASRVLVRGPFAAPGGRVHVRGLKFYADGALGSRGAALLQPYRDAPDTAGLLQMSAPQAIAAFAQARDANLQVAVHAIGDRANRLVLDGMATALQGTGARRRWRIEHAQTLAPDDVPRFARLGVIASMQPSHAIGDLYFAPARLGPERLAGAYAWRSLLEAGATICAGSDAPVERGDPRIEFYAAVHRHALDGYAGPDWHLEQAVTRPQALRMLTASAAFAVGREHELGTLEAGRLADVTAFDLDLMEVASPRLLDARARLTIVGGRVLWDGSGRS